MTSYAYNYERFDDYVEFGGEAAEFAAFPDHLHVGDRAPDIEAHHLGTGETIRISDVWAGRNVVLEFGSFT